MHREMSARTHLAGQDNVAFQHRAASEASLRTHDVVFAARAGVTHLHQGIDLGAALDTRLPHGCPIHGGEGLNFNVVLDHGDAGLHDLELGAVGAFGEAETVAADDYRVLENHPIAD